MNCLSDMKQTLMSDYSYLMEEDFKYINDQFKKKDDLSLLHVNARSIPKNFDLLTLCLSNLNHTFSVVGVSETWLNQENCDMYGIDNYNHVYRFRTDKVGGGTSLYVNTCLEYKERHDIEQSFLSFGESVFIETYNHTIIGCIYKPPDLSISDFNSHLTDVLDIVSRERKDCYIMGDFNINIIDSVKNTQIHSFLDTVFSHFFYPVISKPTRVTETSATLIDNIFTNVLDKRMNSGILCIDISDHLPIFLMTSAHSSIMDNNSNPSTYRLINSSTINQFKELIEHLSWDTVLDLDDPQRAYTVFINEVIKSYNVAFPEKKRNSKSYSKPTKPWVTLGIIKFLRNKYKLYKKYLSNPTPFHHRQFIQYRNKLNHIIRGAKKHYFSTELSKCKDNMRALWCIIN